MRPVAGLPRLCGRAGSLGGKVDGIGGLAYAWNRRTEPSTVTASWNLRVRRTKEAAKDAADCC